MPGLAPTFANEDKAIMSQRRILELAWLNLLTTAQRAAWLDRWRALSPLDIKLKSYTPYTPTALKAVLVKEPTAYAWSQIYGVYRFKFPPVASPVIANIDSPIATNLTLSNGSFTLDYTTSYADGAANLIIFATAPDAKGRTDLSRSGLRPMCFMKAQPGSGTLNFWQCLFARTNGSPPHTLSATIAAVNENNELRPSLDVQTGSW